MELILTPGSGRRDESQGGLDRASLFTLVADSILRHYNINYLSKSPVFRSHRQVICLESTY